MSYTLTRTGAEINEKIQDVHGGIHVHDNSTAQTIPTGLTYTKVINFGDNDASSNVTSDAANNQITVLKAGDYRVEGAFSFSSGTNNVECFGSIFVNDVETDSVHWTRKIQTAGDVGNANFSGIVTLSANDVIDFRTRHDNISNVDLTFSYMNLNVNRVGL